jgi:hypothetical protein
LKSCGLGRPYGQNQTALGNQPEFITFEREHQMSISPKLMFGGITRAIFARLRKKASKRGIHVVGPAGEATKDGVRIQWNYDAALELLEVECIHVPFWIDSTRINKELRQEIEATLDASRAA